MNPDPSMLPERDERLGEILAAWIEAVERGETPDRAEWLARHAEFAAELQEFVANRTRLQEVAEPLCQAVRPTAAIAPSRGETPRPTSQESTGVLPMAEMIGRSVGEYELLDEIGHGGMGLVYRARHRRLQRLVALKMLRSNVLSEAGDVQRFRNEAEVLAQLDHPHIVPVYDVGEHEGRVYFSMKLIESGGLDGQLDRLRDDLHGVARLVAQVARAVHHAHQRGILHRDLKPSNILLDQEGQPHVSDFGLAKRIEANASLTQTGAIIGTPQYMAPEQTSGRKEAVTTATDVYGLGAVLFALLTGRPPFRGETVLETLEQVRERETEPPRRLNAKVDRDLETICLKCLQKEPQRRYESAQALAEDLERWLHGEPIQARRIGWASRTWCWCRRKPFVAALTGLSVGLALTLLIGLMVSTWLIAGQRDEINGQYKLIVEREHDLRRHLYVSDIRLAWQALREGERERMRSLLDRHIPEAGQEDLRGFEWWYLQLRSRGVLHEAARVAAHEGGAYCVTYSPDGRTLASAGKDGVIRFWEARTLHPQGELRSGQGEVNEVAFSPDGKTLASAGDDGTVWLWDVASARQRTILRPEGCRDELSTLAISPDGKILAAGGKDGGVWSWDLASGRLKAARNLGAGWINYLSFAPDGRALATANEGDRVFLLDPATLQERGQFYPYGAVHCVSFSHEGRTLATASGWGGRILLWDPTMWTRRIDLPERESSCIRSVSFSPNDALLASCEEDGHVKLWDVRSGSLRASIQGHAWRAWSTTFSPDGKWLATAGQDGIVKLWHVRGGDDPGDDDRTIRVASEALKAFTVVCVAFSPDGQTLFTWASNGELGRWSSLSGQRAEPEGRPAPSILQPALAPGSRLATATGDKRNLRVQDLSGAAVQVYRHAQPISVVAISSNGERVAFADRSPAVWIWEVGRNRPRELSRLSSVCECLAFAPDGRTIAVAAADTVLLLDTDRGQHLAVLSGHEKEVHAIVFSPDGWLLATAARDNTIRIWNLPSGRERCCLWTPGRNALAIAFSPDGKTLASGNGSAEAILWNVAAGQELMRLDDHKGRIYTLAFSPDGKILAAGGNGADSKNAEVTLWYADGARANREP